MEPHSRAIDKAQAADEYDVAPAPAHAERLQPAPPGTSRAAPVITIEAGRRSYLPFQELWEYRELLYFLAWRDVKIRYKQTAIGIGWAVIQPVITMLVFTAIFHRVARISADGVAYPVFAFAGLLPWHLFAGALQRSIQSLVGSTALITKVYFPRLIIPLAATVSATVDFAVAFVILMGMAMIYGVEPTWRLFVLPGFVALALLAALAVGLWLSALNVRYRDVGHAVPFLVQVWLFVSPVAYPVTLVPERWQLLYSLNPVVAVVEGFRWAMLGQKLPALETMAISGAVVLLSLVGGLAYFRRVERTFADVI